MEPVPARKMWRTLEPIHGMIYFAPEAAAAYKDVGVDDFRMGYFASRSAPMGAVAAEVVIATFFNFNPALVRAAIPAAWSITSPEAMLAARLAAVDAALARMVPDTDLDQAAELARTAATGLNPSGRPLFAGHASLPWPTSPPLVLWHALSLLREYRGDGHIAAMVTEGVTGIEALVLHAASGDVPRPALQSSRAWSDDEWEAAVARLHDRGWVTPAGEFTDEGRAHRQRVEDATDRLALAPWEQLGQDGCDQLRELGRPLSQAILGATTFGRTN